jgi:aminoglycoside 2'-N-acetyltransferase I
MTPRTVIIEHDALPEAAFALMQAGFPEDAVNQRAFWEAHPESAHALVYDGEALVGHAGLIIRTLYTDGRAIETAYVEYVCAEPRRHGYGTLAMRALEEEIRQRGFALAGLATGSPEFYERLGWQRWRGPRAYRAPDGAVDATPDEIVMVLDFGAGIDLDASIECDWRAIGDVW